MKKIVTIILLTLCLIFTIFTKISYSSNQINVPREKSTKAQQMSKSEQRGSDKFPVVVKVIPSPVDAKKPTQTDRSEKKNKESDWWLIRFTGALAIVGFLQLIVFGLQALRLRQTVEVTKESAQAAKAAAESLPKVEKAFIFAEVVYGCENPKPKTVEDASANLYGEQFRDFYFQIFLHNHGKTMAILPEVKYNVIKQAGKIPQNEMDLVGITYRSFEGHIVIKSGNEPYCREIRESLTEEEWKRIWDKSKEFLCLIRIIYIDIFSKSHSSTFCWRYDIDKRNFVLADTPLNIWG